MQKDVVLVTGNFNVLHPGHIRLIKFEKNFAQKVIIGVFSDELAGTAVDVIQDFRLEAVASIGLVDQVLLINTSLSEFILEHKPDVIVKGKEYEDKFNPELEILQAMADSLYQLSEIGTISNSGFGETDEIPLSTKNSLASFMNRHSITSKHLSDIVHSFSNKNICVIGDIIIDQYIDCFALGCLKKNPHL